MVPSAPNGTIRYCLISEKLLMLLGSCGKCVERYQSAELAGISHRTEEKKRKEKKEEKVKWRSLRPLPGATVAN